MRLRRTVVGVGLIMLAAALSCAPPRSTDAPPRPERAGHLVRVALAADAASAVLSATGGWHVFSETGVLLLSPGGGTRLTARGAGGEIVLADERGRETRSRGSLVVRAADHGALLTFGGRRYRGELAVHAAAGGLLVVNRLPLEEYLRGVVPLEIGPRTAQERAAVEAQAIAARSYARVRLRPESATRFDLVANVTHQVYGGADAELPLSDEAVRATDGLVITYGGRIVDAVYHSTCGGSTAAASEVWRSGDQPYLQAVSDRVPGTDRHFCDISPRFRWTREIGRSELTTLLGRYLRNYAEVGSAGPGTPRAVAVDGLTPSGRVRALAITTDQGRYTLRGNDMRYVLRESSGAILGSTYFSVENYSAGGVLDRLTLLGAGYGHGIGMCQWGAIGRARAGQNFRSILGTYYPGTRVEKIM
jgi:stage II sporulation protein D